MLRLNKFSIELLRVLHKQTKGINIEQLLVEIAETSYSSSQVALRIRALVRDEYVKHDDIICEHCMIQHRYFFITDKGRLAVQERECVDVKIDREELEEFDI